MSPLSKKNTVGKGTKPRQLKTLFGDIHFTVPRRRCQACGAYFLPPIIQERLDDFDTQKGSNITKSLRRIATLCGASWPDEQAADVIDELTGVAISHDQIIPLCDKEALVIKAEPEQNHDSLYNDALVETMESLVDYLADEDEDHSTHQVHPNPQHQASAIAPPQPDRFYMGIDGVYIGALGRKKQIEAKVGIVFTDERAEISKGRNLLLNKQYTGTYQPVDVFGQRRFCCATEMGVSDNSEVTVQEVVRS